MTASPALNEQQMALQVQKDDLNELLQRGFPVVDQNGEPIERFEVKRKGRGPYKITAILKEKR